MPARKGSTRKSVNLIEVPEERTFVNPSAVSPHLSCPICQEVFVNPQRAPCGHSFCKACIDPWLTNNPICPLDRRPVTKGSMHHDFLIENVIGDYMVACPWRALGCDFIGPLHLLPSHKKSCLMNPGSLPPALRAHTTELMTRSQVANTKATCLHELKKSPSLLVPLSSVQTTARNTQNSASVNTDNESALRVNGANTSSSSPSPSTSQPAEPAEASETSVIHVTDDEEEHLPPVRPPNLLFRLYHNSDTDSRDLLCSFLDNAAIPAPSPPSKRRKRR
ncbi:hypothetical protein CRM22_003807 [Opisthorchis felineus]|uniref:RING-type domain-containing protein n=1 Tax=Opisthorchis felineus TaxID=147828 RepID=A0A4S2LZD6_OPIFE|nr:hypothetical protein CRM22_003807 [Opisthorchis felineus]